MKIRLAGLAPAITVLSTFVLAPTAIAQEVLFGVTFNDQLIRIDPNTGAGTLVGPLGFSALAMGVSSYGGELYILDQINDRLVVVNPFTGNTIRTVHVSDPNGDVFSEGDFEIRSDGTGFYSESNQFFNRVNIQSGAASLISSSIPFNIDGLAFAQTGALYGLQDFGTLYNIDPATGNSVVVGGSGASSLTGGLDFRSDGTLFGVLDRTLYRFNPGTGARTVVGDIGFDSVSGITFMVIPEPGLFGVVSFCMIGFMRRPRFVDSKIESP